MGHFKQSKVYMSKYQKEKEKVLKRIIEEIITDLQNLMKGTNYIVRKARETSTGSCTSSRTTRRYILIELSKSKEKEP